MPDRLPPEDEIARLRAEKDQGASYGPGYSAEPEPVPVSALTGEYPSRCGNGVWFKTSERRPTISDGEQCDVIFGSSVWSWPIVGMYTHFPEESDAWMRWSMYDQINDRFVEFFAEFSAPCEPEFWMYRPELPAPGIEARQGGDNSVGSVEDESPTRMEAPNTLHTHPNPKREEH